MTVEELKRKIKQIPEEEVELQKKKPEFEVFDVRHSGEDADEKEKQ